MKRLAALILLILLPVAAFARCDGADTIAAMPAAQRADLLARAAEMPYGEGLMWRAEKGDTRITLFGTYHFRHPRTNDHLAALIPHIEAADAIYLEVSAEDQQRLDEAIVQDPSIMFIAEGPTLPDLLGERDWRLLADALAERGLPSFMVAKFKPIYAAMMLGLGPCEAQSGVLEEAGIDQLVGVHAARIGNPSRSLEDFRTALLLLDGIPQDEQLDMIRLFLDWDINPDDLTYTLRETYLAGKIALFWEYGRVLSLQYGGPDAEADFEAFEDLLLTRRNADWMKTLDADGITGEVLIAVGAAHLPGENGLLRLLEGRGYAITRLPFDP